MNPNYQRKTIRLQRDLYRKQGQPFSLTICTNNKTSLLSKFQELIFKSAIKDHLNKESDLMAVCVMPDHIHFLLAPISKNLIDLIGEWKSYTTHLLWNEGYMGKLWQRSFYDHALRCEEDLIKVAEYIVYNPVRKGLVKDWREYRYSWHKWM
jgi:REP element-mobilizing transposase RayT